MNSLYHVGEVFKGMPRGSNVERLIFCRAKYLRKIAWNNSAEYHVGISHGKRTAYSRMVLKFEDSEFSSKFTYLFIEN